MTGLSDSFQRPIDYLRVSVTDRCNLRCIYCMPPEGIHLLPREDILSYEEIHRVVRAAVELGITRIRLTGGEPLVRDGFSRLVALIARIEGIKDLSLTTNGILLSRWAARLKAAGVGRVNVSLDSLREERFREMSRGGRLRDVLRGIRRAQELGLTPVKLNTVVVRGINDDEILDFARRTLDEEWHVRFIELMPFGREEDPTTSFVSVEEIQQQIAALGRLEPCHPKAGNGPAQYFRLPGARGTVGFISPVSEHFCVSCNRMRLTADGRLRLCLLDDAEEDLRGPLRRGASVAELKAIMEEAVAFKPAGHRLAEGMAPQARTMSRIGG
ncbi:MAG: GTP 3',8-cyclase MoaA [Dehalococcoidia bacterium]